MNEASDISDLDDMMFDQDRYHGMCTIRNTVEGENGREGMVTRFGCFCSPVDSFKLIKPIDAA